MATAEKCIHLVETVYYMQCQYDISKVQNARSSHLSLCAYGNS